MLRKTINIRTTRRLRYIIRDMYRNLVGIEHCKVCGTQLTKIRGEYVGQPNRKVCACCSREKLEWLLRQQDVRGKQAAST